MKIVRYKDGKLKRLNYGVLKKEFIHPLIGTPFDKPIKYDESRNPLRYKESILVAPCEPTKVVALAINYKGATGHTDDMTEPLVFIKGSNTITGPNAKVKLPFKSNTWGESELAVVIRKTAKNIRFNEVSKYIFGFVPANDVSCDNVDNRDHHLARSKSADGFCPLGHYIDTSYEPENKTIRAYHNDILLRLGNTNDLVWDINKTISWLTSWMTLYPGDVVLTGTPSRVRDRLFLKGEDTYTVDIEGFPKLVTKFHA